MPYHPEFLLVDDNPDDRDLVSLWGYDELD